MAMVSSSALAVEEAPLGLVVLMFVEAGMETAEAVREFPECCGDLLWGKPEVVGCSSGRWLALNSWGALKRGALFEFVDSLLHLEELKEELLHSVGLRLLSISH